MKLNLYRRTPRRYVYVSGVQVFYLAVCVVGDFLILYIYRDAKYRVLNNTNHTDHPPPHPRALSSVAAVLRHEKIDSSDRRGNRKGMESSLGKNEGTNRACGGEGGEVTGEPATTTM